MPGPPGWLKGNKGNYDPWSSYVPGPGYFLYTSPQSWEVTNLSPFHQRGKRRQMAKSKLAQGKKAMSDGAWN